MHTREGRPYLSRERKTTQKPALQSALGEDQPFKTTSGGGGNSKLLIVTEELIGKSKGVGKGKEISAGEGGIKGRKGLGKRRKRVGVAE